MALSEETKHNYQKRIKDLEVSNRELCDKLYAYKTSMIEIFDGISEVVSENKNVNTGWILKRLRRCFR